MPTSERNGFIALFGIILIGCTVWYFSWVKPHDEFMSATLDCTGSHLTQAAWDKCAQKISAEKASTGMKRTE